MNNPTPTNYKAWRRLDWALLTVFTISFLSAVTALGAKGGKEDWANWAWAFASIWCMNGAWNDLFGKRPE